jgi:hypothetical protein
MTANEFAALTVTVLVVCARAVIGPVVMSRANTEQNNTAGWVETLKVIRRYSLDDKAAFIGCRGATEREEDHICPDAQRLWRMSVSNRRQRGSRIPCSGRLLKQYGAT